MNIQVQGHWRGRESLALSFTAQTVDLARIQVPTPLPPGPADGLWQHTCFEVFIAATGAESYVEYNLSPSGQWARYVFSAERRRDASAEHTSAKAAIPIRCERLADRLIVRAELPLADLPPSAKGWRVGLSAVIEDADGQLGYWALHHPRPQPDFHHPGGRILRLLPPVLP